MTARKRTPARLAVLTAIGLTAAAAVGTGVGSAEAATLPGAAKSKSIPGGGVTIKLFDQSYTVQRPVTHVPTSREVHVSGKVLVTTRGAVKGGTVTAGYLVGCQLDFGADSEGDAGVGSKFDLNKLIAGDNPFGAPAPTKNTGVGAQFSLAPGESKFVPVIKASIDGQAVDSFTFTGQRGGVAYSQERFGVDGCAGFAQARALVNVRVATDDYKGNITLYGRPFSIG